MKELLHILKRNFVDLYEAATSNGPYAFLGLKLQSVNPTVFLKFLPKRKG
jgi:hypothetical protein